MTNPLSAVKTEAVGIFDDAQELHRTIEDLEISGFARSQISVRGSDAAVKNKFGHASVKPEHLQDNPHAPRSAVIGREDVGVAQGVLIGAGAWIGSALALIATNGLATNYSLAIVLMATLVGGILGALAARYLSNQYTWFYQKQANKGGLVLWIETPNAEAVDHAQVILKKHGAHNVHIHDIAMAI